jgi:dTDP-4-amino-4,6-dideoxygalactose transaminase
MDPDKLSEKLQQLMSNPILARRVKAIIPVHTFGQIANMPIIMKIADKYNLPVIEDSACALGSTLNGKKAGSWGLTSCFSFHPRKAITTGEGGMVTTNDKDIARNIRMLRNHGLDPESNEPDFIIPGYNYRMTEFQAAMGIAQMRKIGTLIARRRELAGNYFQLLSHHKIKSPFQIEKSDPVYQSYVVLLPGDQAATRKKIIEEMRNSGIETTIGTINIPMTSYYRQKYGFNKGDFPVADDISARSLTLPLFADLSRENQELIVNTLLNLTGEVK